MTTNAAIASPEPDDGDGGQPTPLPDGITRHQARGLIGWLPPDVASVVLYNGTPTLSHLNDIERAHAVVAGREPGVDQSDIVAAATPELLAYVTSLQASGAAAAWFVENWGVGIVDLARVCAYQPAVDLESATARVAAIDPGDLVDIARVTMPSEAAAAVPVGYNQQTKMYTFASPNHNLQVVGNFQANIQEAGGAPGFGFIVATKPSCVSVAEFQGRHFLRDGYHRSVGLLNRGIRYVPAFVKELGTIEELVPTAGMLPQAAYLGDRPPTLADYLDDSVSASVELPTFQKVVMVQAAEFGIGA